MKRFTTAGRTAQREPREAGEQQNQHARLGHVGDGNVLERFAQGQTVTVQNACQAYLTP